MTPELIKASAYLLEKIERRPAPAGEMINTYLATHKYLKGEDKKEFLALVWGVIRAKARLMWAYPEINPTQHDRTGFERNQLYCMEFEATPTGFCEKLQRGTYARTRDGIKYYKVN